MRLVRYDGEDYGRLQGSLHRSVKRGVLVEPCRDGRGVERLVVGRVGEVEGGRGEADYGACFLCG